METVGKQPLQGHLPHRLEERAGRPVIVVTGQTLALGVIRSLGKAGAPVVHVHYEAGDIAHVSRHVLRHFEVPHPEKAENEFLDRLKEISGQFRDGILMPVSDEALVAVSRNMGELEKWYTVACTEWDVTRKFIDKKFTYALAASRGIPAPRTLVPQNIEEAETYGKSIGFPCLVKPCQSHRFSKCFGKKMFFANDAEQLRDAFEKAEESGLDVMIQEYIPGEDHLVVNYNAYFWDGEPLVECTARHIRNAPPRIGAPRVVVSQEILEVLEPGRGILRALGFSGFACTEFKKDPRDGIFKLMEVNGRHNLSTLLSERCGVNFPWIHYRHLAYGEIPAVSGYRKDVYWIHMPRDISFSAKYFKQEKYSPLDYLRPYLKPHVFAILDLRDPKPFIKRSTSAVKRGCNAMWRRIGLGAGHGEELQARREKTEGRR